MQEENQELRHDEAADPAVRFDAVSEVEDEEKEAGTDGAQSAEGHSDFVAGSDNE